MFSPADVLAAQTATGIRKGVGDHERQRPGGLGRFAAQDPRDLDHPLSALIPKRVPIVSKRWAHAPPMNQGQTSRCVAFAWTAFLKAAPKKTTAKKLTSEEAIDDLYHVAQTVDEWPGESYNGTSVRAGAKVLHERGLIGDYLWTDSTEEMKKFVIARGTVVVGTDWREEMFYPEDHKGELVAEGPVVGGHAWLIIGWDDKKKRFIMLNSWGAEWGENGIAYIDEKNFDKLRETGSLEICSAIETRPVVTPQRKTA